MNQQVATGEQKRVDKNVFCIGKRQRPPITTVNFLLRRCCALHVILNDQAGAEPSFECIRRIGVVSREKNPGIRVSRMSNGRTDCQYSALLQARPDVLGARGDGMCLTATPLELSMAGAALGSQIRHVDP